MCGETNKRTSNQTIKSVSHPIRIANMNHTQAQTVPWANIERGVYLGDGPLEKLGGGNRKPNKNTSKEKRKEKY